MAHTSAAALPVPAPPPILIVGAGPVGLTLAVECLRHGASCRIIERSDGPAASSRAALIQARTLEALDDIGIARDALCRGREVRGVEVYAEGHRVAHLAMGPMETPFPFLLGLEQRETELLLAQHLERLGGRIERRTRLVAFAEDDGGVSAQLALPDGAIEAVRASFLIGCDGAQSTVREGLGLPFPGEEYDEQVVQADLRIRFPGRLPEDQILAFFAEAGTLVAMPLLPGGCYRLMATQREQESGPPTLPQLQAIMDARGPQGTVLSDPLWMKRFPIHRRLAPCFRVGRALLAGDAAHLQSPLSGQGMNLGIQDAYNLGWKLALVARGEAPPALLDSYEAERRPIAEQTLGIADAVTRTFAGFMRIRSPRLRAQRDRLLGQLARDEGFLSRLSAQAGMLDTRYEPSSIITEHRAADGPEGATLDEGPAPGERAADVPLAFPEGGADRLLERLRGRRHSLFLFCGARTSAVDAALLAGIGAEVDRRFGRHVGTYLMVPHLDPPEEPVGPCRVVLDPDGAIHRRYGAEGPCLYVIRPDKYVGYRSQPIDAARLTRYLEALFIE